MPASETPNPPLDTEETVTDTITQAGYVALLGRPNVGKSTLLNRLLAHKLSITSPKPQTTRHAILGICTQDAVQIVYVDTPGVHRHAPRAINRYMNRVAQQTVGYVDVVVWLVEALRWTADDEQVLNHLADFQGTVIAAINKVDRLAEKSRLLPFIHHLTARRALTEVIPLSARSGDQVDRLQQVIRQKLPVSPFLFSPEQVTTCGDRFRIAEIIREKLMDRLHQELPYAMTVEVERVVEQTHSMTINAVIWVERTGQRRIVIGEQGSVLKAVGSQARRELEALFNRKIHLETWVKVRTGWSDDEQALQRFGYRET